MDFMDGVMKLLAVRLLDVVVHGGLCDAHKKNYGVSVFCFFQHHLPNHTLNFRSCPSSMGELGATKYAGVEGQYSW